MQEASNCKQKSCIQIFRVGSQQFRESPRELLRELWFEQWDAVPRMGSPIPRIIFWTPKASPRIPRNSPRAPRRAFSLRERYSWNWGGPQASDWCRGDKNSWRGDPPQKNHPPNFFFLGKIIRTFLPPKFHHIFSSKISPKSQYFWDCFFLLR